MRRLSVVAVFILLAAGGVAAWQALPKVRLGAAWYAKTLCSGVFVRRAVPDKVIAQDVLAEKSAGLRRFSYKIDRTARLVGVSLFGVVDAAALYRPGIGCTLLNGTSIEQLMGQVAGFSHDNQELPDDEPWPKGRGGAGQPLGQGETVALRGFLDREFAEPNPDAPKRTRAIVIAKGGRIIAERYGPEIDANTPLPGWSMAKSAINALVGVLIGSGKLSLERSGLRQEWSKTDDPRGAISVAQLLQMTSGLEFDDPNADQVNDVRRMVYLERNSAAYAAEKPLVSEPGAAWRYSSGSTALLSALIDAVTSGGEGRRMAFPREALFDRIGMTSAVFERDGVGTLVGSAFLHATARDWARLGLLYLQDGLWDGERVLPDGWVAFSRRPAPGSGEKAGAHFWLRVPTFLRPQDAGRRPLPKDAYFMLGRDGQMVAIVPSRDLVAVRLGLTRDRSAWDPEAFLDDLLEAIAAAQPS